MKVYKKDENTKVFNGLNLKEFKKIKDQNLIKLTFSIRISCVS